MTARYEEVSGARENTDSGPVPPQPKSRQRKDETKKVPPRDGLRSGSRSQTDPRPGPSSLATSKVFQPDCFQKAMVLQQRNDWAKANQRELLLS